MVIKTILDTDLYKFTTSYAYIKLFPYAVGTFSFKDRDETEYTEGFLNALRNEIQNLKLVALTEEELEYMCSHCRFFASCVLGVAFFVPLRSAENRGLFGRKPPSAHGGNRLSV